MPKHKWGANQVHYPGGNRRTGHWSTNKTNNRNAEKGICHKKLANAGNNLPGQQQVSGFMQQDPE
jgi:hypothetical protein